MRYKTIEVRPIAGALGAEIHGVDLSRPLDNQTFSEIHDAFLENLVIFFRDQALTPEQHKAFGRRFGELSVHPFVKSLDGHPEVIEIVKEPTDRDNFGGSWHSDLTFTEKPALGSILYAKEVPATGGDTMFANMYLAYETLSSGMKWLLDGLVAVHSGTKAYGAKASADRFRDDIKGMKVARDEEAEQETEHPVVRTHPETGRKGLYVNQLLTLRFKDMTEAESAPLLEFLCEHAVRPEFTCRFRWATGSVAFWDNRCIQHYALNDYAGQRRWMHRITVKGDRPF